MSLTTIGRIVKETCVVIWDVLCEKEFISPSSSEEEWKNSFLGFKQRWHFANALGAIGWMKELLLCLYYL